MGIPYSFASQLMTTTILEVDRTRLEGFIVLFEYVVTKMSFFQLPVDGNNNMYIMHGLLKIKYNW